VQAYADHSFVMDVAGEQRVADGISTSRAINRRSGRVP